MSQPPNQQTYGGPPQHQRGGYNPQGRPMGAWQPAAPTSLQMASQQQNAANQQYAPSQQRGGAYTVPPHMANPYAYGYAPQYPPQQQQQQQQQRVGSWNPTYTSNVYAPNAYYQQQGIPQQQQAQKQPAAAPRAKKPLVITVRLPLMSCCLIM